jgi:hypothetical protein
MVVSLADVVCLLLVKEGCLVLVPEDVREGRRLADFRPDIEFSNPGAVHILQEGGNHVPILLIQLFPCLAALSHL